MKTAGSVSYQGAPSGVSLRACGPRKLMKMLSPLFSVRRNFYLAFSTLPNAMVL